jgi:hypothetical protein
MLELRVRQGSDVRRSLNAGTFANVVRYACATRCVWRYIVLIGKPNCQENNMGRGILLWMLGVPIPVILLLAMCSHH